MDDIIAIAYKTIAILSNDMGSKIRTSWVSSKDHMTAVPPSFVRRILKMSFHNNSQTESVLVRNVDHHVLNYLIW